MFILVNEYGNVYKEVKSNREKEELLGQGYKVVENKETSKVKNNSSKGVKQNVKSRKN